MYPGGGGGACGNHPPHGVGGAAGGIEGLPSEGDYSISKGANSAGYQPFQGENGGQKSPAYNGAEGNGGGGGGWYGGYSYQGIGDSSNAGGGGGSSYISGNPLCDEHQL